jgi:phosphoglucomutase
MNYKDTYNAWIKHPSIEEEVKNELEKMDEQIIKESFYGNLSFGTAGMRGILGLGTNRLNIYTVRKATLGYANYLIKHICAN